MRYTITSAQLNYFRREGWISFETLFSQEELSSLKGLLDLSLLRNPTGRDLERGNPLLIEALHLPKLVQLTCSLTNAPFLSLAFTQTGPCFTTQRTLSEVSSMTEILGGWFLSLETGVSTFFANDIPIDFPAISDGAILIVFSGKNGRYRLSEEDPHTHLLKKLGYGFGDRLTKESHPSWGPVRKN